MKSVILKSLVLMGVIGTSCFLVYQAKDGLPGVSSTPNNEEFTSLDAELGEAVPWGGSPSGEVAQPSDSIATSEKPDSFLNQLAPPNQIDESPEESLPASADDSSLAIGQFQWQSLETQTSEENHETVDVEPTPAINPFAEQPGRLIANTSPSKEDSSKLPEPRIEKSGHTMPLFFSPNKTEEAKEESPESETVAKNESPEQSEEQPEPTLAETAPQPEVDPFAFPGAEPAPIPKQEDEAPPVASSVSMSEGITGLESPDSTAEPKDPGSTMAPEEVVDVFAGLVPQQPEGDLEASSVAHAESSTPVPESGSPQSASDEDQFSAIELNSPPSDQSIGRVALPSSVEIDAGEEPSSPNLMPVGDSSARPIADNSEGPVGEIGPLTEIGAPRNRSPRAMAFGPHQGGETTQSQNPTTILEEPQLASERPRREGAFGPSVEPPPKKTEVLPSEDNLAAGNRQRFTAVTEPVPTNLDPFGGFADTTPPPPRTRAEPAVMPRPEENPFAFGNSASPTPRTREEVAALPLPPVEPTPVEPVSVDPAEPSFVVNRDPGGEVLPELGQPSPIGGIDDSKRLAAAPPEVLPEHPELIENRLPEPTPARTRSSPQTFPNPFAVNDEPAEVLPSHRLQDSAVRNTLAESPNSVEIVMPAGFEDGLPPPTTSSESPQSPEESDEILPSLASDTALSNPTVVEPDDTVLPQPLPGSGETIPADPSTNPFAFGTPTPTDSPTSRNDEEVLPTPVERNPIPVVETAPTQAKVIEITPRTRPEGSRQPERPTGLPPSPYAPTRLDSPQTEVPTGQLATSPASPDSGNAMPTAAATASPVQELLGDGVVDPSAPSGPQTPELQIEKIAPPQAVIGEPLVYSIIVRNVGGSDAREVTVEDRIPRGARLEGTIPQAILAGQKLIWNLGTLEPTEERRIQLKVVPIEPGDIGSVAKVSFAAAVSASIRVTAPDLKMTMDSPLEALVGERIAVHFNIANHGEGEARSVILRALLPDGLTHPGGNDIEYEVGSLAPGAQKSVDLILTANAVGKRTPLALISNDGKRHAELRRDIQIIETRLQVERSGPERRFVGRSGNYTTKVANLSSKRLTNIEIQETIPNGVSLTEQPTRGEWNPGNRTVTRRIPVLEPGETQEFVSQLLAEAPGAHVGTIVAHDDSGNQARVETVLDAKGFSALDIDLAAKEPVIAVGDQISFRLKLRNDGSAEAADVRTRFEIPSGFEIVNASGPVNWQSEGNAIQFASLQKLDANGEQEFDIVLVATEEGTKKVTVKLESADYEQPVITEEPVRVISDSP